MTDRPALSQPQGEFVGRETELTTLLAALQEARAGRGSLLLIGGEPGIGKSRLANELAARARAVGAVALWGRCWEGAGAPAYWPWVQIVRNALRSHEGGSLAHPADSDATALSQLLPELNTLAPDGPLPGPDADAARFRLFDAVATLLRATAANDAAVVVIDDLQAADTPSLLLARFMATQLTDARIVLVATYRDVELTPDHPVTAAIADMLREPTTRQLHLRGLDLDGVEIMARRNAVPPALVAELHRQTGGNPLFLGEAIKLLASEGSLSEGGDAGGLRLVVPGAIREVITRRLQHVSDRSRDALAAASVLGPEVSAEVLRRLVGVSYDQLLETLDEAIGAGLLAEVGGSLARFRFTHELIREVLYESMSAARRVRLHLRTAEMLESLEVDGSDRRLAEIAHHLFRAAPVADPGKVRDYARRAADHAVRQLAYEEAVRLLDMALQALEVDETADATARCHLLLDLGDAQMRAGDTPRAKQTFLGAAGIARRLGLPEELARAALGYGGRFVWARAANDRQLVPLLEDALAVLGDEPTTMRAQVLARLSGALRDEPTADRREQLSREAVTIARALGDRRTLAYALDGRFSAIWAPDTADERLSIADEMVAVAEAIGDAERVLQGRHYRLAVSLERGDIAAVHAEIDANIKLADGLRQPAQRWYIRATIAILSLLEGRYSEAEAYISEAFEHGRQAESVHSLGVVTLQQYALRREQDRAHELETPLRDLLDEYAFWPWMRVAMLHLYTELDRRTDARGLLEAIAGRDFRDLPWDNDWLLGAPLIADAVFYLRDMPRAAALYELLEPYGQRNGYGHPEFCVGAISRSLGSLAGLLGRWAAAESQFGQALEMNERMGARPWAAHTRREYALMLLARDGPGDRERAHSLLADALAEAHSLGMASLERKIGEALEGQPSVAPAPTTTAGQPLPAPGVFRREGEYWTVGYDGASLRLRDSRGLAYLARLLAEPGREFLALDLARDAGAGSTDSRAPEPGLRETELGDAGTQLDATATADYRRRLRELQEELDEAESWNDPERADRAREEMEFLARELARGVGLGGRERVAGSASERARISVTRAIRLAMTRIARHSPALGRHLETTIHTGTYCSYRPDPRVPIKWET